jgi:hypothetical protein
MMSIDGQGVRRRADRAVKPRPFDFDLQWLIAFPQIDLLKVGLGRLVLLRPDTKWMRGVDQRGYGIWLGRPSGSKFVYTWRVRC